MRIPTKVVCLWSCLAAFTFTHTAVAQDYLDEPQSGAGYENSVAPADYIGSATLEDGSLDPYGDGQGFAPLGYQGEVDPSVPSAVPPPMMPAYPPPMMPQGTNYWPQVSPFEQPVMERTYRQRGIWVNDAIYDNRTYLFNLEYMKVGFNRPGTDMIGSSRVGVPTNLSNYRQVNTGVFSSGEDFLSDGLRGTFIMRNGDSSTLELSAFYVAESRSEYLPFGSGDISDLTSLRARGFIGLEDGTVEGLGVAFDTEFKLGYKQQAIGGDILWSTMPVYETTGIKLRPVFGLKYLKIREQFTLHGEDSALDYLGDAIGAPIGTVSPNPFGNPAFASDLKARTVSDLAGPEIGIRYEVGGNHFLLSGQSRLAVAANHEVFNLNGNQIGDGIVQGFPTPTPANPKPSAFADKRSQTHVSPIFSQDFNFKAKIFRHLPILNDLPLLADANMLVGYNFVLVGNVARPTKGIDWRANNPRIETVHSRWYMQSATFGLQWEY